MTTLAEDHQKHVGQFFLHGQMLHSLPEIEMKFLSTGQKTKNYKYHQICFANQDPHQAGCNEVARRLRKKASAKNWRTSLNKFISY